MPLGCHAPGGLRAGGRCVTIGRRRRRDASEQTIAGVALPRERARRVRRTDEVRGGRGPAASGRSSVHQHAIARRGSRPRDQGGAARVSRDCGSVALTARDGALRGADGRGVLVGDRPARPSRCRGGVVAAARSILGCDRAREGRVGRRPSCCVEAKANVAEFTAGPLAAKAEASVTMIHAALDGARAALRASQAAGCVDGCALSARQPYCVDSAGSGKPGSARCSRT